MWQGVTMDTVYDHLKGREPVLYGRGTRFEGLSTTADAYRQWEIPAPPAPRARAPGENVPFDGTSSYKMDYPAHDIRPARPAQAAVRPRAHLVKRSNLPTPPLTPLDNALLSFDPGYDLNRVCSNSTVYFHF